MRCPTCSRPMYCGAALQRELQLAIDLCEPLDADGERKNFEALMRVRSKLGTLLLGVIVGNVCAECNPIGEAA